MVGYFVTLKGRLDLKGALNSFMHIIEKEDITIGLTSDRSKCALNILKCIENACGDTDQDISVLNLQSYQAISQ